MDVTYNHPMYYFRYVRNENGLTIHLSEHVVAPFTIHCFGHHILIPHVGYVCHEYRGLRLDENNEGKLTLVET